MAAATTSSSTAPGVSRSRFSTALPATPLRMLGLGGFGAASSPARASTSLCARLPATAISGLPASATLNCGFGVIGPTGRAWKGPWGAGGFDPNLAALGSWLTMADQHWTTSNKTISPK